MWMLLRLSIIIYIFTIGGCGSLQNSEQKQPQKIDLPIGRIPEKNSSNTLSSGPTIIQKASLGIIVDNHTQKEGAYIVGFDSINEKSPAESQGLQKFDIISRIDSCEVKGTVSYFECLNSAKPYSYVVIVINRDGYILYKSLLLGGRK